MVAISEARLGRAGSRTEDDAHVPRQHAEKPHFCGPVPTGKLLGCTLVPYPGGS